MKKIHIALILVALFFSPYLVHCLVSTPSPIGFITPEEKDTWINFFGSIIGGGATLIGVWVTIKEQKDEFTMEQSRIENQRREDLAIQYKPVLHLHGVLDSPHGMYYRDLNFVSSYSYSHNNEPEYIDLLEKEKYDRKFIFSLKNIGRGCIANGYIKSYSIKNPDDFDNQLLDHNTNISIEDLVPNQEMAIVLHFPGLLRLKNDLLEQDKVYAFISCTMEYTDEFDFHRYKYNIFFIIKIQIRKTDYDSGVEGVSIIAPIYSIAEVMPELTLIK